MKTAIVTGNSGQLGPVWCETLEEMGFEIFGIDLPECDITNRAQVIEKGHKYTKKHKAPDVIVLNAAIDNPPGSKSKFHGNVQRIMDVNIIGATNVVAVFLPLMMSHNGGVIIGISSIQGRVGADWRNYEGNFEKPVGYNLSKAALEQYVRSLTVEYGRYGIRACCIGFGAYDGGKLDPVFLEKYLKNVPVGRAVSKQSIKAALRFAIDCPEFAGQTAMVDGGYTIL